MRAVIFDLDGTLVDSLDDITSHLRGALQDAGRTIPERDDVRGWVGDGAAALVERAVDWSMPSPPSRTARAGVVADVLAKFRLRYDADPSAATTMYAGVDRVLDALRAAHTPIAILSNKPHELTVSVTEHVLGKWHFDAVVGHRDGARTKPDPSAALAIATSLGLSPTECVFVGDSDVDVKTAQNAGMISVAVTWGMRDRAIVEEANPSHIVENPDELIAILASLRDAAPVAQT